MRPLSMVEEGTVLVVRDIHGGKTIKSRMESLGLKAGKKFEVLKNSSGPLLIKLDNTRIMLGFGEANKIYCKEV